MWRELGYAGEGVPIGGKVPWCQSKHHWRPLGPYDHFMNGSVEWVCAPVQENRHFTVTDIAYMLDMNQGSVYSINHKDLGYCKICARWVPKYLTDEHRWAHLEMCMQFLQWYCEEGEVFLHQIVTDEAWLLHYRPVNQHQSVEWKDVIIQDQEIKKCAFFWQSDVDAVLGF